MSLAIAAVVQWRARRDTAAGWLAVSFATIGLVAVLGRVLPQHPDNLGERIVQRFDIVVLLLFPYTLYRFATAFHPPSARLQRLVVAMTTVLVVWTLVLPRFPAAGEARPGWFVVYLIAFLIHWTVLTVVVASRLWRAGRTQPSVARTRMRMLSFAAAAITVAIFAVAISRRQADAASLVAQLIAFASAVGFGLGLAPPQAVRLLWRRTEQRHLQETIGQLMTLATTPAEIAQRVLPPTTAMVGARASALLDGEKRCIGSDGLPPVAVAEFEAGREPASPWPNAETVRIEQPGATLVVWTSPYAPFFGQEELRLLETLAALTGIALDRVRLFQRERDSRVALERANEVMSNFVALAAHELRTPVTTIHGFVVTLNRRGAELPPEQRAEVAHALEQQTTRMAGLVEQLLDLSRLDADRIDVRPQRIDVRPRVEETVAAAAGPNAGDVVIDVPDRLHAIVDPSVLDRILTNLVTNAFRYGRPPVHVSAARDNGSLCVAVEDNGDGVAAELAETLFERFTRAGVARDRVAGTGLGLAIARAYARAHSGELRYEPGTRGARFVFELPARS